MQNVYAKLTLVASAIISSLYFSASAGFLIFAFNSHCLRATSCSATSINLMRSTISVVWVSSLMRCFTLAS